MGCELSQAWLAVLRPYRKPIDQMVEAMSAGFELLSLLAVLALEMERTGVGHDFAGDALMVCGIGAVLIPLAKVRDGPFPRGTRDEHACKYCYLWT